MGLFIQVFEENINKTVTIIIKQIPTVEVFAYLSKNII